MRFRSSESGTDAPPREARDSSTLRAFALLELIAAAARPPTLDELTRTSGLPKPSVYRILAQLVRARLADREPSEKRYVIGPRICALALAVHMHSPARGVRHAILARLVEEIGETCNLTMLEGGEVVYADRVETSANVRLHMKPGSRVPLHCTASGKLFLAHLPPAQVRPLLGPGPLRRYTDKTLTSVAALERELARIRATGIATDVGEYLAESVCLAIPVRAPDGRLYAAIAVHGPAPRMSLRKAHGFLPALRRAAEAMRASLGDHPTDAPQPPAAGSAAKGKGGVRLVPARHHHRGDHRRGSEEEGQPRRTRHAVGAD